MYEDIANAALLEAIEDYKIALIHLKKNPDSERTKRGVREGERFLYSEEFGRLTALNPDYLNRKLKEYVDKKYGGKD